MISKKLLLGLLAIAITTSLTGQSAFADVDTSPDLVSATPVVGGDIDLVWTQIALSNGETFDSYELWRHTSGTFNPVEEGTNVSSECTAMTTDTTTTCTDTSAVDGTTYYYEIVYTTGGTGAQTDVDTGVEFSATADGSVDVDSATISSSGNVGYAKSGDVITVTLTSDSENLTVTAQTINTLTASVVDDGTLTPDITRTVSSDAQGTAVFSITVEDSLGNSQVVTAVTDLTSVVVDTILPVVTPSTTNINDGGNTELTSTDQYSESCNVTDTNPNGCSLASGGIDTSTLNGGAVQTATYQATDLAGNVATTDLTASTTVIDTTDPVAPTLTSPTDATSISDLTPTFDWSVGTDLDLTSHTIQIDDTDNTFASIVESSVLGAGAVQFTSAGLIDGNTYYWRVIATDGTGNTGISAVRSITIDVSAPSISSLTISSDNITIPDSTVACALCGDTVTITLSDGENMFPVSATIDGETPTSVSGSGTTTLTYTLTLDGDETIGLTTFSITFEDGLSNQGTVTEADLTGTNVDIQDIPIINTFDVSAVTPTSIDIDYDVDPLGAVTTIEMYRSLTGAFAGEEVLVDTDTSVDATTPLIGTFVDSGLTGGLSYYYQLDAFNVHGTETATDLDSGNPVITTNIPVIDPVSNVSLKVGGSYSDTIPACNDVEDGVLTATSSGSVNVGVAGTYSITYDCVDLDGNDAISVVRTVTVIAKSGGGSSSEWQSKPTFAISYATDNRVVENGFSFNGETYNLVNWHTDFKEKEVRTGQLNSFDAKVYADKGLRIQEFLFGIPNVGDAHKAELGIEVHYNYDGTVDDVKIIQKTDVIDEKSVNVLHTEVKCSSDSELMCDNTNITVIFNEPLKDKVMAIKAIDFKNRYEISYLNDGFNVFGEQFTELPTIKVMGSEKYEGQIDATLMEKYSNLYVTEDGRIYEMFGTSGTTKLIFDPSDEIKTDDGLIKNRSHSAFNDWKVLQSQYAKYQIFNSDDIQSQVGDSYMIPVPEIDSRTKFLQEHNMLEFVRG